MGLIVEWIHGFMEFAPKKSALFRELHFEAPEVHNPSWNASELPAGVHCQSAPVTKSRCRHRDFHGVFTGDFEVMFFF